MHFPLRKMFNPLISRWYYFVKYRVEGLYQNIPPDESIPIRKDLYSRKNIIASPDSFMDLAEQKLKSNIFVHK